MDETEGNYELVIPEGLLPFEVVCRAIDLDGWSCNLVRNVHLKVCPNCEGRG